MIFSILALLALCVSIVIKDRKTSLYVQSLNCLFEAIYDFIISAFTGAILSIINLIRTFLFINKNRFNKIVYLIILFLFEGIIIVNCYFSWSGWISLLPTIGSIIRTYCLWQSNMKLVRISGITKKIENDIKELAITAYNEELEEEYLTLDNFDEYVGPILLDTTIRIDDSMIYYILSLVSFTLFIGVFLVWLMIEIKNRKVLKKYSKEDLEKIGMQIYSLTNNPYQEMKLYLTKSNLVDLSNGIVILKYEDLTWAYPYEYRYNGLLVNKVIKVITNNNESYEIANTKLIKQDKDKKIEDILNILKKKNSNIKTGYTKETKKEVKENFKNQKKETKKIKKEEKKMKNKQ